jgi:predicted nucleotidyltransferase
MNNQHTLIKEKLASPEYNFLSKIPNIIILTLGGSHAYGTSTPTSDIDIRGIAVNSAHEILTMNCKDKPIVNTQTDTTIYFLKQIVSLLSACNPNTIEILGTRIEDNFILTPQGQLLRDNIHLFLSQRAIHSFGGYATAQLRRLQNALARDNYPQSEKENHILQSIQGQNQHIQANTHHSMNMTLNYT